MDIKALSDILLNIFYVMVGLMMILTMIYTLKDKNIKLDMVQRHFGEY